MSSVRNISGKLNQPLQYMSSSKSFVVNGKKYKSKQGWTRISIYGTPYQRGFAHGFLLHKELQTVESMFPFLVKHDFNISYKRYLDDCSRLIVPIICREYPEIYHELQGIVAGYAAQGHTMDLVVLIAWNSMLSMFTHYSPASRAERCSAFIACGNATEQGDIVMAHNSHSNYVIARVTNIILQIKPEKGHMITMQCCPGYIASGTDWFITSKGIMGCETTIGGFLKSPNFKKGTPYFCRIRQAMQYADSLDEYASIMTTNNAGDYPCGWMFGDIYRKEIMLCELGLEYTHVEKKKDGIFYGMNSATNELIRKKETNDRTYWDTSETSGARNVRLHVLLYETYMSKLNIENAKKIISDHHDVFLDTNTDGTSRTICKHSEKDRKDKTQKDPRPFGAIDGKVINSAMAKKMSFYGIFGSSCGQSFSASSFRRSHRTKRQRKKYHRMTRYLRDLPSRKWIILQ